MEKRSSEPEVVDVQLSPEVFAAGQAYLAHALTLGASNQAMQRAIITGAVQLQSKPMSVLGVFPVETPPPKTDPKPPSEEVLKVIKMLKAGKSPADIYTATGKSVSNIANIKSRWKAGEFLVPQKLKP